MILSNEDFLSLYCNIFLSRGKLFFLHFHIILLKNDFLFLYFYIFLSKEDFLFLNCYIILWRKYFWFSYSYIILSNEDFCYYPVIKPFQRKISCFYTVMYSLKKDLFFILLYSDCQRKVFIYQDVLSKKGNSEYSYMIMYWEVFIVLYNL